MTAAGTADPVRVVGRYEVHGAVAAGGMATVHLGRLRGPAGFTKTVAVKRLHSTFANDPEFVAMFLDEARLTARVQHPNVVQTLDVFADGGELFVVMEYVRGVSLARLVRLVVQRGRQIPRSIVLAIVHDVLEGLQAAHEACAPDGAPLDIVHRDVSPQNILVGADGRARVLDFGIAKAVGRAQHTKEGELRGKLAYMAPEQLSGSVEQRTDVFAAAVVLWEALTGRHLLKRDTEAETVMQILSLAPEPPSVHAPEIDAALDAVVMKGLAPRPGDRHASAGAMARELAKLPRATPQEVTAWLEEVAGDELAEGARNVARVESAPALEVAPAIPAESPSGTTRDGVTVDVAPPRRYRRALPALAAFLLACGVGGVGLATLRTRGASSTPAVSLESSGTPPAPVAPVSAATASGAASPSAASETTSTSASAASAAPPPATSVSVSSGAGKKATPAPRPKATALPDHL